MTHIKIHVVIHIKEHLEEHLVEWFPSMQIAPQSGNGTILIGDLYDQADLHGCLERIRDLNLNLVSVQVEDI